jgi:hypothetical protein
MKPLTVVATIATTAQSILALAAALGRVELFWDHPYAVIFCGFLVGVITLTLAKPVDSPKDTRGRSFSTVE